MCINANTSVSTFIFSIIGSSVLIFLGNKKYKKENLLIGITFMYVALMQILEYFMWIDLNGKKGTNKIATSFGPFLNYTQPTILYLAKSLIFKKHNIFISLLNLIYYIYVIVRTNTFMSSEEMITTVVDKHLHWRWTDYFSFNFYALLLIINIFTFILFKYALMIFLFIFGTLSASAVYFKKHIGEFWCFLVAYVPVLVCICTYLI
jgi:hypothetical protein